MAFTKLDKFSQQPSELPNVPSPSMTPDQIRDKWQVPLNEILANIQQIVDDLNANGWVDTNKIAPSGVERSNIKAGSVGTQELDPSIFSEPTSAAGVQATLAQHNERLNEIAINVKYPPAPLVGAKGDRVTDDTQTINNIIAIADTILFPTGVYKITDELTFKHGQTIFASNGVTLDGTDFIGVNGDSVLKVTNDGDDYDILPSLTGDLVKYQQTLTFTSAHGLSVGDIICLYDNTDSSWSSARTYYRKSEFCRVAQVTSTTEVLLENGLFDDYTVIGNANFGTYKMNMGTFNIIGSVKAIQGKQGAFYGIKLERLKDTILSGLDGRSINGSYTAISTSQCYNLKITGMTAIQEKLSGLGGDYGLLIANSQHCTFEGYFSASRHGITHGGDDGIGCVINRDIKTRGTVKTNGTGNVQAFNTHGNVEFIDFDGFIDGGVVVAGSSNKIRGVIRSSKDGICVLCSEIKAFNHDFSGAKLISTGNPKTISKGVFDFGGNGTAEVDNMIGGTFKLIGTEIIAPQSESGVYFRLRNTTFNSSEPLDIDMSNIKVMLKKAGTNSISFLINNVTTTRTYRLLNITNSVVQSDTVAITAATVGQQLGNYTNVS